MTQTSGGAKDDLDMWDRKFVSTYGTTYRQLTQAADADGAAALWAAAQALPKAVVETLWQDPSPERLMNHLRPILSPAEPAPDAVPASPQRADAIRPRPCDRVALPGLGALSRGAARVAAAYDLAVVCRSPMRGYRVSPDAGSAPQLTWFTPELIARSPYLAR